MTKLRGTSGPRDTLADRGVAVLASLVFSIPTAGIVWLLLNVELAFWGGFLGSAYFWGVVLAFAAVAFVSPRLFPEVLGKVWEWLGTLLRWL